MFENIYNFRPYSSFKVQEVYRNQKFDKLKDLSIPTSGLDYSTTIFWKWSLCSPRKTYFLFSIVQILVNVLIFINLFNGSSYHNRTMLRGVRWVLQQFPKNRRSIVSFFFIYIVFFYQKSTYWSRFLKQEK